MIYLIKSYGVYLSNSNLLLAIRFVYFRALLKKLRISLADSKLVVRYLVPDKKFARRRRFLKSISGIRIRVIWSIEVTNNVTISCIVLLLNIFINPWCILL